MFKKTRKKLTLFNSIYFIGFFFAFLIILYFSLVQLMDYQQIEELETYYKEQYHDFFEHKNDNEGKLEFNPNGMYFYYIYTKDQILVHGDENYQGLFKDLEKIIQTENPSKRFVKNINWRDRHLLILSKPIQTNDEFLGYIVIGKSTTSQYHFFQKMILLFIVLIIIFTIIIGFLSYYMAGKAMIPIQHALEKQKSFVSDASHELRTPLSVFYSSLDILESDEASNMSDFGKELIEDLKHEAELMKELLDKLLFLARHDKNRIHSTKEKISLTELLLTISRKFKRALPKSIVFETEIQPNIEFIGNSNNITELIYILLDNAAQYTQRGSIYLKLLQTDKMIYIYIEDTGIGISKEDLPFIFDRFFRSDAVRNRNGTGLGLAIADSIVQDHGGTFTVQSELEKGTTFCIQFPLYTKK